MKKARTQILKILGGVLALLLILGLGAGFALNTATCQNRIMDYTTDRFIERLGTYVKVDSVVYSTTFSKSSLLMLVTRLLLASS